MLRCVDGTTCKDRPIGCREHSALIYNDYMYIYGGFTEDHGSLGDFWSFDISKESLLHENGNFNIF